MDFSVLRRDFGDIDAEARACRAEAALFDFSFMARGRVSGPGALAAVQALTPRPLAALRPGRIAYAVRVDAQGFARADLTVWRHGADAFEVFSGRREDIAALTGGTDLSDRTCILAVQGPGSLRALAPLAEIEPLARLAYFEHVAAVVADVPCRIGRLGYTGERGFEIVAPAAAKAKLWDALAARARPAGWAAADMLRIEAGFVLFLNEFRPDVTPEGAGLGRFGGALGHPRVSLVGFRADCAARPILFAPGPIRVPPTPGTIAITSATSSVHCGGIIGLGYVNRAMDGSLTDGSGQFHEIRNVGVPFIDPEKRRVRGPWGSDLMPRP